MKELTDAIFEKEVLKAENLVMVDFWAPWCGPCKMMEPIIDALAVEFGDKPVGVMKLNVDENNQTASQYGVMSIPTFLFFTPTKDNRIHKVCLVADCIAYNYECFR